MKDTIHYEALGKACNIIGCGREAIMDDGEDILCERHMPDPNVRSWGEMKAEGIEIETMEDYRMELTTPYEPPEPDDYYDDDWRYDD